MIVLFLSINFLAMRFPQCSDKFEGFPCKSVHIIEIPVMRQFRFVHLEMVDVRTEFSDKKLLTVSFTMGL